MKTHYRSKTGSRKETVTLLDAGRKSSLRQAMVAELTLLDLPKGVAEVPLGNVVRACIDTVAAADAGLGMVGYHTRLRVLAHGLGGADRNTARVDAMHAMAFDERETVGFAVLHLGRAVGVDLDDVLGFA